MSAGAGKGLLPPIDLTPAPALAPTAATAVPPAVSAVAAAAQVGGADAAIAADVDRRRRAFFSAVSRGQLSRLQEMLNGATPTSNLAALGGGVDFVISETPAPSVAAARAGSKVFGFSPAKPKAPSSAAARAVGSAMPTAPGGPSADAKTPVAATATGSSTQTAWADVTPNAAAASLLPAASSSSSSSSSHGTAGKAKAGSGAVKRDHSAEIDILSTLTFADAFSPRAPASASAVSSGAGSGLSPLSLAVLDGDSSVVSFLLSDVCNARVDFPSRGRTPLLDACQGRASDTFDAKRQARSAAVVQLLLAKGASVHAVDPKTHFTALHIAAVHTRTRLVPLLLAAGADPFGARDTYGRTAMDVAQATPASARDEHERDFLAALQAGVTATRTRCVRKTGEALTAATGAAVSFDAQLVRTIVSYVWG